MNNKYSELFKEILRAYYDDNFDTYISNLILREDIQKEVLREVISSLCGVDLPLTEDYVSDLKTAIKNYTKDHKVVNKIKKCNMDCTSVTGKTICQVSCPFDAIIVDASERCTSIDDSKCTDCGLCVEACPTGSLLDKVEFLPLLELLQAHTPVIAAVAPAISGQFGKDVSIYQLRSAFKLIGFTDMVEVAFFADMLTLKEAVEFDHHVKNKDDFMITSCCCPMWVAMVKRVYNDLVRHVSPSISPMIASGRVLKKLNPNCKVVFIGPCVAKKAEAKEKDLISDIDFVLTFAELKDIFEALNIYPAKLPQDFTSEYASRGGRLYARTGGVSEAVEEAIEELFPEKYKYLSAAQANGVKECRQMLTDVHNGIIKATFMEGMGCPGGCVGGPKAIIPMAEGTKMVNEFAETSSIRIAIKSQCMNDILKQIGINSIDDFKHKERIEIFEREF